MNDFNVYICNILESLVNTVPEGVQGVGYTPEALRSIDKPLLVNGIWLVLD